jgi:hypothetical protein
MNKKIIIGTVIIINVLILLCTSFAMDCDPGGTQKHNATHDCCEYSNHECCQPITGSNPDATNDVNKAAQIVTPQTPSGTPCTVEGEIKCVGAQAPSSKMKCTKSGNQLIFQMTEPCTGGKVCDQTFTTTDKCGKHCGDGNNCNTICKSEDECKNYGGARPEKFDDGKTCCETTTFNYYDGGQCNNLNEYECQGNNLCVCSPFLRSINTWNCRTCSSTQKCDATKKGCVTNTPAAATGTACQGSTGPQGETRKCGNTGSGWKAATEGTFTGCSTTQICLEWEKTQCPDTQCFPTTYDCAGQGGTFQDFMCMKPSLGTKKCCLGAKSATQPLSDGNDVPDPNAKYWCQGNKVYQNACILQGGLVQLCSTNRGAPVTDCTNKGGCKLQSSKDFIQCNNGCTRDSECSGKICDTSNGKCYEITTYYRCKSGKITTYDVKDYSDGTRADSSETQIQDCTDKEGCEIEGYHDRQPTSCKGCTSGDAKCDQDKKLQICGKFLGFMWNTWKKQDCPNGCDSSQGVAQCKINPQANGLTTDSGSVYYNDYKPVHGAVVTYTDSAGKKYSARTDSTGRYTIQIQKDTYQILAEYTETKGTHKGEHATKDMGMVDV